MSPCPRQAGLISDSLEPLSGVTRQG
jgi:hypothetical protein